MPDQCITEGDLMQAQMLVYFQNERGRPCDPEDAFIWCRDGAWEYAQVTKPPRVGKKIEEGTYLALKQ